MCTHTHTHMHRHVSGMLESISYTSHAPGGTAVALYGFGVLVLQAAILMSVPEHLFTQAGQEIMQQMFCWEHL